jgi:hypothetical protein
MQLRPLQLQDAPPSLLHLAPHARVRCMYAPKLRCLPQALNALCR